MKYLKLSICTMIVTKFIMKVIAKFKNERRSDGAYSLARLIGVEPDAYETAAAAAEVAPGWKILLFFHCSNREHLSYFNIGKSLGPVCDELISRWCNEHLGSFSHPTGVTYTFRYVDIQPIEYENVNLRLPFLPMEVEHLRSLMNLYNSLLSKAK